MMAIGAQITAAFSKSKRPSPIFENSALNLHLNQLFNRAVGVMNLGG
jgi:hypothetical protein